MTAKPKKPPASASRSGRRGGRRVRRKPEEARREALDCARRLMLEKGPGALTLTAVARSLGVTHGTITYHFGTVAALHKALVETMAADLSVTLHAAVLEMREGRVAAEEIVETAFRAFDEEGAGKLIAWLVSTQQTELLQPLFDSVREVTERLREGEPGDTDETERGARITTLMLLATALGGALIGEPLHAAVGLPGATLKHLAAAQLKSRRATPIRRP